MRRKPLVSVALVLLGCMATDAQIAVNDPAVTARNSVTAGLQEYLVSVQRDQHQELRRMARRLSAFTNLDKYAVADIPQWRIHVFFDAPEEPVLFARDYHAALNYGDASGNAYLAVTIPLMDAAAVLDEGVDVTALRDFAARLATINVADATAISATNDAGHVRYNGRRELRAITRLNPMSSIHHRSRARRPYWRSSAERPSLARGNTRPALNCSSASWSNCWSTANA